ncbi:TIGR04282 family arsenosugar biosynthesis glycosyltransferase [Rhodophyticola sp. MJ-SS7]|nr:TIGR04282 family arsenosugar biosynthesis glycosyltransferase [Rhodophyticola sp. MJ-SS7]
MPISRDRRPALIVMVKAPRPGRVKTRLGRDLGMVPAAWWYRHQVRRLLRRLRDPRWRIVLAVAPDLDPLHLRTWPSDVVQMPQGRGDLGARMARALHAVRGAPALLIGSDIPGIDRAVIGEAFDRMRGHDGVIGPSEDGGYWCIGLGARRRLPPGAFAGVRWSTDHALDDTVRRLAPLALARARRLADVDRAEDLRRQ